ncbi:lipopolysaccharide biosynthesis protein [Undibacterium arcticum]|uniref:Lipopolysaccharide biosynthesis protein n=1 Tax=Undibacterium arcticum TaxID=1762892 RepID=A0ABV7FBW8_9BURK
MKRIPPRLEAVWSKYFSKLSPITFIGIPMLLGSLYFGVIAKDRYVSESQVMVRRSSDPEGASSISGLSSIISGGNSPAREDVTLVLAYIQSLDMLQKLDARLQLRQAFKRQGLDFFSALPADANQEDFLIFFNKRIEVSIDDKTGFLKIRTQGFTPEFAEKFNQTILAESEHYINEISYKIAREQVNFIAQEVALARKNLDHAKEAVLAYQNKHGLLDPIASAEAAGKVIAEMEARESLSQAELRNLKSYLNDNTPQVIAARNALDALQAQINAETTKLTAPGRDKLNRSAADFMEIKADVEFKADLYKLALSSVEKARIETARKLKNLIVIYSPHRPEEAEYPGRIKTLITMLVVISMLYAVLKLVLAIIKDHRE